jgi:hypothetical protein
MSLLSQMPIGETTDMDSCLRRNDEKREERQTAQNIGMVCFSDGHPQPLVENLAKTFVDESGLA